MGQLFRKVQRGAYQAISSQYSQDLAHVIKCMLQQNPAQRPSCEELLAMPQVMRNTPDSMQIEAPSNKEGDTLLSTIRLPLGGRDLSKIKG